MLNTAAIVNAQFSAPAASAPLVAALGAGSASIISAQRLGRDPLPAVPLIAFRQQPTTGASYDMRGVVCQWWVYDDPAHGTTRINPILALLEAAYPRTSITHCHTEVSGIGAEVYDSALGLIGRSCTITSYTRG